jgi:hypothetical protein
MTTFWLYEDLMYLSEKGYSMTDFEIKQIGDYRDELLISILISE